MGHTGDAGFASPSLQQQLAVLPLMVLRPGPILGHLGFCTSNKDDMHMA